MLIIPVIMAGGAGTRLWPISRETNAKQFIPLFGGRSSFQDTLLRVMRPDRFATPIVITSNEFRFLAAEQARAVSVKIEIVLEPVRRDSGPTVAVAAALALARSTEAIVLILAADHSISDVEAFHDACHRALAAAQAGYIVAFGVEPSEPATRYGYLEPGEDLPFSGVRKLASFIEKPDTELATLCCGKGFLWNSGNLLFAASTMHTEFERLAPTIAQAVNASISDATHDLDFLRLAQPPFERAPKISIDYAIMEKTDKSAVLATTFPWSDIGCWNSIWALSPKDQNGNALSGSAHATDAKNVLVRSESGMLTTVVGIEDAIIVATKDAVLVASRTKSEQVKHLVEELVADGCREAIEHRHVYRPWGYYQRIDYGDRYQVKRLVVKPGCALSLQKHHHRAEHWVVVRGTAEVVIDETITIVQENEYIFLPLGCMHQLINPGKIQLELVEVQVGSYLGEDDIVRIKDIHEQHST